MSKLSPFVERLLRGTPGERYAKISQTMRRYYFQHAGLVTLPFYQRGSRSYRREKASFHAGAAKYYRESAEKEQRYELRRHIHMMEKGLCMSPRRDTFAAGYVIETVNAFSQLYAKLDPEERDWANSVLSDYFGATESSNDVRIRRGGQIYRTWQAGLRSDGHADEFGPYPVGEPKSAVQQHDLHALMTERTSVRSFTSQKVSRNIIDAAVLSALQAPTACNRVPWNVRIFDEPVSAQSIAGIAMGTAGYLKTVSHVAVFVGDQSAYFDERDRHLIYIDTSLAAMSFVLSLQSANVSTCCVNWPDIPVREAKMAAALGLQAYERVIMLVVFGYPEPTGLTPFSGKKAIDSVRMYG